MIIFIGFFILMFCLILGRIIYLIFFISDEKKVELKNLQADIKYREEQKIIEKQNRLNKVKCPACQSSHIHKISAANKVGSVAVFGVFAVGHVNKVFKCDDCGYKF